MGKETIVFIAAHSDDHVLGGGATIAKYVEEGKQVDAFILSYGEMSHPWLRAKEAKKMRAKEAQRAGNLLGCSTTFFDLKESKYLQQYQEQQVEKELIAYLKRHKPTKVFTHSPDDPHPDHRATFKIVNELIKQVNYKPDVFSFAVWNPFTFRRRENPRLYVDTSKTFKKQRKALGLFRSQLFNAIYPLYAGVVIRAIRNGLHIHTRYAEMFYRQDL